MLWEFFKTTSARIKAAAKSVKTKFLVLIGQPEPEAPEKCPVQKNRYTSKAGRAMNKGQWCRLTSSHAPIFSLFTYFGDRQ
jgi:hypothetical protein